MRHRLVLAYAPVFGMTDVSGEAERCCYLSQVRPGSISFNQERTRFYFKPFLPNVLFGTVPSLQPVNHRTVGGLAATDMAEVQPLRHKPYGYGPRTTELGPAHGTNSLPNVRRCMLSEHCSFDKLTTPRRNNADVEKNENDSVHVRHVLTPSPRVPYIFGRTDQYPVTARSVLSSLPF